MITWNNLVYSLNELSKLPNGNGSEIEFDFRGKSYIIIHYKDKCSFSELKKSTSYDPLEWEWEEKIYNSLEELGQAKDFGFSLRKQWKNIENLICKPDFDDVSLNTILDAYRDAIKK